VTTDLLSPKSDYIFKLLMGDDLTPEITVDFLQSMLDLPEEEFITIEFMDTHLNPEEFQDKYGILDVRIRTRSGKIIDI